MREKIAAVVFGAIGVYLTVFVTVIGKPSISLINVAGSVKGKPVHKENQRLDLLVFRLTVRNDSLIPGFIKRVKIVRINPTSKKTKLEVLWIDKKKIYYWEHETEVEVRIQATVWTSDALTADDPQFRIQGYDDAGQQLGGGPYDIKSVARQPKPSIPKERGALYYALQNRKVRLHFNDTDERNVLSNLLAAKENRTDVFFNIATMYEQGTTLPQDSVEAIQWYEKAAALGHEIAYARAKRLSLDLFGMTALREKVLVVFYVVDARNRLVKAIYTTADKNAVLHNKTTVESPMVAPSMPGKYKVISCVNPDNRIEESDERDNCEEYEFTVSGDKSRSFQ